MKNNICFQLRFFCGFLRGYLPASLSTPKYLKFRTLSNDKSFTVKAFCGCSLLDTTMNLVLFSLMISPIFSAASIKMSVVLLRLSSVSAITYIICVRNQKYLFSLPYIQTLWLVLQYFFNYRFKRDVK